MTIRVGKIIPDMGVVDEGGRKAIVNMKKKSADF